MTKTKAIVLIAFVLSMGAGVAVGMLSARGVPHGGGGRSFFIQELRLTPDQQKQMDDIWTDMIKSRGHAIGEQLHALQEERQAAISALLNDEQKRQAAQINDQFARRARELWQECEPDFLATTKKARAILDGTQQQRFDALLEKFRTQFANADAFAAAVLGRRPATAPSDTSH